MKSLLTCRRSYAPFGGDEKAHEGVTFGKKEANVFIFMHLQLEAPEALRFLVVHQAVRACVTAFCCHDNLYA